MRRDFAAAVAALFAIVPTVCTAAARIAITLRRRLRTAHASSWPSGTCSARVATTRRQVRPSVEPSPSPQATRCASTPLHCTAARAAACLTARRLPLAFVGTFDDTTVVRELWQQVWSDAVAGHESGVRLYQSEILGIVTRGLQSAHWVAKKQVRDFIIAIHNLEYKQAGKALAAVAQHTRADALFAAWPVLKPVLVDAMKGRTWVGALRQHT